MRTKTLLANATPETAKQAIATALEMKWTPAQIKRHGSPAVLAELGTDKASPRVATKRRSKSTKLVVLAERKPKPQPNFEKATPVAITLSITPRRGGAAAQIVPCTGQQHVIGARGAEQVRLTTESGQAF